MKLLPSTERRRIQNAIWRWLVPKTPLVKGTVLGHKMIIPNTGRYTPGNIMNTLRGNLHEPETTRFIENSVESGQTAIDIGANVGYFTLLFAKAVGPKGTVHAFEPNPTLAKILRYNVRLNNYRNVIVNEKAVSDKSGIARFYVDQQIHERSSLNPRRGSRIIDVDVIKLDDYFEKSESTIDWIKLDVEGHESKALAGMKQIFNENKNIRLIVEFIPNNPGFDEENFFLQLEGFAFRSMDHNLLCWKEETASENNSSHIESRQT